MDPIHYFPLEGLVQIIHFRVYFVLFLYPQLLLFTYWVNLENDKLILMSA